MSFQTRHRRYKQLFGDADAGTSETGATATSLVYRHKGNDDYVNVQVIISNLGTIVPEMDGSGNHANAVPIPNESWTASGVYSIYLKEGQTLSLDLTGNDANVDAYVHW